MWRSLSSFMKFFEKIWLWTISHSYIKALFKEQYILSLTIETKLNQKLEESFFVWSTLEDEVNHISKSLHGRSPSTARGVSMDLVNSLLPRHPLVHHPPPLGCMLLHSPSTGSHPSLLRFHFNRWSSSSVHTPLWENLAKENKIAKDEM